jgi:alpha-ribazole phosphatase
VILVWRHPRPEGAAGRCIGAGTELAVHRRRAKRLARRIQQVARRERLPHIVQCSPLQRCSDVARWLRRWGWQVRKDPALLELDFGSWDGRPWSGIARTEVDAWVRDFHAHAPGEGESLQHLLSRASSWTAQAGGCIAISHGGWMLARRWFTEKGRVLPEASTWPTPPAYGELWRLG